MTLKKYDDFLELSVKLGVGYTGENLQSLMHIFFLVYFVIRNSNPKIFFENIKKKKSCATLNVEFIFCAVFALVQQSLGLLL